MKNFKFENFFKIKSGFENKKKYFSMAKFGQPAAATMLCALSLSHGALRHIKAMDSNKKHIEFTGNLLDADVELISSEGGYCQLSFLIL